MTYLRTIGVKWHLCIYKIKVARYTACKFETKILENYYYNKNNKDNHENDFIGIVIL